jgi:hypothetical protein
VRKLKQRRSIRREREKKVRMRNKYRRWETEEDMGRLMILLDVHNYVETVAYRELATELGVTVDAVRTKWNKYVKKNPKVLDKLKENYKKLKIQQFNRKRHVVNSPLL